MSEPFPCQHIPLNAQGQTIASLYPDAPLPELEVVFSKWLLAKINELEHCDAKAVHWGC
ncbi:MAG TPA: hypothetical protein VGR50_06795 [Terriglobales bacterium]|nr:hypothetical protein [Terriglobales bacterium]